jgi:SAM-dependent methyltransferase
MPVAALDPVSADQSNPPPVCPVCDSSEHEPFTKHRGMRLFTCGDCSTVYLWPLPRPDVVEATFTDAYDGATTGYFGKVDSKMRRCRRRLAWLSRFAKAGRFLDIGCNGGFIVEAARERGFEAHGLDIDPISIRYAEKHYPANRFYLSTIEAFEPDPPRFDLVYCSEVIEHIPDVQEFAEASARLVAPGGYLFITTPDIGHWNRPRDLVGWDGFSPPSHCIYFRPRSLRLLMERHGLTLVRKRPAIKPGIKLLFRRDR